MSIPAFIARQPGRPSGIVGRAVLPRLLNRRNAALNDLTLACLQADHAERILEVGCGGGYLLERLCAVVPDGHVVGVDHSPEMVAHCRRRYRVLIDSGTLDIRCAPAEALPYGDVTLGAACSVNTLFYLHDPAQALSELARVLTQGATLVLCFTDRESLERRPFAAHGLTVFGTDEVTRLMSTSGFRQVQTLAGRDRWRAFTCASGVKA